MVEKQVTLNIKETDHGRMEVMIMQRQALSGGRIYFHQFQTVLLDRYNEFENLQRDYLNLKKEHEECLKAPTEPEIHPSWLKKEELEATTREAKRALDPNYVVQEQEDKSSMGKVPLP